MFLLPAKLFRLLFVTGLIPTILFSAGCGERQTTSDLESISDVESMIRLADGNFQVRCKDGSSEIRSESEVLGNRVCLSGGSGTGYGIIFGRSDSCDLSNAVAEVTDRTVCSELPNGSACSIKVAGQCQNISDTTVQKACLIIKGSDPKSSVVYGRSDSCSADSALGVVDERTECSSFGSGSAWSVKVNGQCVNISDTTASKACIWAQGQLPNTGVVFGRSDSCETDDAVAVIKSWTDCNELSNSTSAWSISAAGTCSNITDTTVQKACLEVKSQLFEGGIIYGRTDSCSADTAIAWVDPQSECSSFSTSLAAWSIRVNGECRNISDTHARNACFAIKGG